MPYALKILAFRRAGTLAREEEGTKRGSGEAPNALPNGIEDYAS